MVLSSMLAQEVGEKRCLQRDVSELQGCFCLSQERVQFLLFCIWWEEYNEGKLA